MSFFKVLSLLFTLFCYQEMVMPIAPFLEDCKKEIQVEVELDYMQRGLKYYTFGITSFPIEKTTQMKVDYHIEVISMGCLPDANMICYNHFADSLLVAKKGKDFYQLVGKH